MFSDAVDHSNSTPSSTRCAWKFKSSTGKGVGSIMSKNPTWEYLPLKLPVPLLNNTKANASVVVGTVTVYNPEIAYKPELDEDDDCLYCGS